MKHTRSCVLGTRYIKTQIRLKEMVDWSSTVPCRFWLDLMRRTTGEGGGFLCFALQLVAS